MPTMPKPTRAPWQQERKAWTHRNRWDGYNTRAWRERRLAFLIACKYKCAVDGCNNAASTVDHVKPISSGHDPYDQANWQALCKPCHTAKSSKEGGAATAAGRGGPKVGYVKNI